VRGGFWPKSRAAKGEFHNDIIFNKIACVLISNKEINNKPPPIALSKSSNILKITKVTNQPILLENKSFWKSALAFFLALIFLFRFLIKQKMIIENS